MENETQPLTSSEPADWQASFLWLRKQLLSVLVLMVVICGALDIIIWHQVRYMHTDVKNLRAMVEDYRQNGQPMENFLHRVYEYAQAHEEFRPVLARYNIPVSNAAPARPAPATPPATLKK